MTTMDSNSEEEAAALPRRRGAPKGNRNAWKHGGRSAAAKAARAAARAEVAARLPEVRVLAPSLASVDAVCAQRERHAEGASASPNKTNNSVAQPRKRGAPKGNKNALKHGMKSAQRRAFNAGIR